MKRLPIYLSLLLLITCAKEDSQDPGTTPSNIVPKYTLTASAGEGGSVSPATGNFNAGTQVSITATPNSGYTFSGWSNGSTVNPVTVTLNSNTSITANFQVIVNSYTLTVSAGEGGSVSSEGGDYEEGTQVTITATPSEGYRFISWSNGSSEESITLEVNSNLEITANFELILDYQITLNKIRLNWYELGFDSPNPLFTLRDRFTTILYSQNNMNYFLSMGSIDNAFGYGSIINQRPRPAIKFKKTNGIWSFDRIDEGIKTLWQRWSKIGQNYIVVGEGNEFEDVTYGKFYRGNIWYGEFVGNSDINWVKVNDDNSMGFFHGGGAGDMNGDGLIDIVSAPGRYNDSLSKWEMGIFFQNPDKNFEWKRNLFTSRNFDISVPLPFTSDLGNVVGDSKDELVFGDFGAGDPSTNSDLNSIWVFKYNDQEDKLDFHFKSDKPEIFWDRGMGDTNTRLYDFNNDEILDIITYRTDIIGLGFGIWLGNGDGTFEPNFSKFFPRGSMNSTEYEVFDANNDGILDILLKPFGYGSNFRIDTDNENLEENNGIILNELIWLGNGDGSFSNPDLDLRIDNPFEDNIFHPEYGKPYLDNGELHYLFFGSWNLEGEREFRFQTFDLIDIKIKI